MQVKKFEAPTIQEALENIKRELGPEAIILQTKKNKRGFGLMSRGSVEITAAVSERSLQKKKVTEKKLPEEKRKELAALPAKNQAEVFDHYTDRHLKVGAESTRDKVELRKKPITQTRYADIEDPGVAKAKPAAARPVAPPMSVQGAAMRAAVAATGAPASGAVAASVGRGMPMEEELKHLKRMIEEMKSVQDDSGGAAGAQGMGKLSTPALKDAFEQLILNGVDKRFALPLIKKASFELGEQHAVNPEEVLDQLAGEIMSSTEVRSPLSGVDSRAQTGAIKAPSIIALVGPTGVGKTTTVAKIASEALLRRNLKTGLINLDGYKVAAFDQLATYAKILNVPFRSAGTIEDLKAAIEDFKGLDLILIDTTGRSQRDPDALKNMQAMLDSVNSQSFLVLSSTTRDTELYDMANRFSCFRPMGLVMSKLDEATIYGSLYNVSQRTKLPLLYFTTGQRVPEDIEEATRERLVALLMDL